MNIINWENTFAESSNFQNRNPTKWAFVKNFLNEKFYEELYNTFPKFDETWSEEDSYDKISYRKFWEKDEDSNIITKNDSRYSESWNKLMNHLWSEDFINNLVKFTQVSVTNLRHFCYMYQSKGGFQSPHIHNVSDKTLIVFLYFSKNWSKGEPGGTYLSEGRDESKIIFEVDDLDNTALFVLDGPEAAHGVRQIKNNVEKRAIQLTYEPFSSDEGWYGKPRIQIAEKLDL